MATGALLLTPRFVMRPHEFDDVDFMMALNSDYDVVRYTGDEQGITAEEARVVIASLREQFAARRIGRFVVLDRVTGERYGWCGLKWHEAEQGVDLGFRFFKAVWGQGFATETSIACLAWGRSLGIRRIFAHAHPHNIGSCRVLGKLGFRLTGVTDDEGFSEFHFGPWPYFMPPV